MPKFFYPYWNQGSNTTLWGGSHRRKQVWSELNENYVCLQTLFLILICSGSFLQQPPPHLGRWTQSPYLPLLHPSPCREAFSRIAGDLYIAPCQGSQREQPLGTILHSSKEHNPVLKETRQEKHSTAQDLWLRVPAWKQSKAREPTPHQLRMKVHSGVIL